MFSAISTLPKLQYSNGIGVLYVNWAIAYEMDLGEVMY